MRRLRNHEPAARPDDPRRLAEDDLQLTEIAPLTAELARPDGGLDLVEPHDPPLGFGDGFLGDHDDVVVVQLGGARDHRAQIGTRSDLGQPLDRYEGDQTPGRPVTEIPA